MRYTVLIISVTCLMACSTLIDTVTVADEDSSDFSKASQSTTTQTAEKSPNSGHDDPDKNKYPDLLINTSYKTSFPKVNWSKIAPAIKSRPVASEGGELALLEAFSNGKNAFTVSKSGEVKFWDVDNNKAYFVCEIGRNFRAVALNIDRALAAVAGSGSIDLYSLAECKRIARLTKVKSRVSKLLFNPDGLSLLAAGLDGKIYRWRFAFGSKAEKLRTKLRYLERYFGHSSSVSTIVYHPEGRVFFSGDFDGAINAWLSYDADAQDGEYDKSDFGYRGFADFVQKANGNLETTDRVELLKTTEDGEFIFVASQLGSLELWKIRGFKREALREAHSGLIYDMATVPGEKDLLLYTLGRDGFVRLWQAKKDQRLQKYSIDMINEFRLPGGRHLVALSKSRLLVATKDGKLLEVTPLASESKSEIE